MERKCQPSITIALNIWSLLCGAQYVTQVSINYKLVYILRLVYIYSPNCRLVYIYQPVFLGVYV